jgi:signal transduction histidine kinase
MLRDLFEALPLSCLVVFLFVFPDGRFVPRWSWLLAVVFVATSVLTAFVPGSPLNLRHSPLLDNLVFFGCLGIGAASQVYRYRCVSDPLARQQTKWVVYGFSAVVAASLAVDVANATAPALAPATALIDTLVVLLIPLSLGVAILRHRLWDIDIVVNRTLLYGALTASVVGIYVLVVGYLGTLFRSDDNLAVSLVAAGLVAVLFQPLRDRLQRGINRLTYGDRDDPYLVLSRLGRRLEATLAADAVLPAVVETVAQALRLPYAAIALRHEEGSTIAVEYGTPVAHPVRLPLVYQQETVGELLLAPRSPGEVFAAADRRLLDDLARHAGVAVHAVRLTTDLRRSRERLVTAREEERRRLRRDLHDGLGPMLGSLTLKLDVASDLLERDPAAARTLLLGLKGQAQDAIGDIRRLVYALRPPALDDLGLVGALREEATRYRDTGLQVTVESPERLPPLPAAVEVAAFRIVQEALTNVARHAGARTCSVRLSLDEATGMMHVEIADNGRGLALARPYGVGLASMRERAEELGGTCEVEGLPAGGTRVRASLPYAAGGESGEADPGSGGASNRLVAR